MADEAAVEAGPVRVAAEPGQGIRIESRDGAFGLRVRPRAQLRDTVTIGSDGAVEHELAIRTLRLWVTGHLFTPDLRVAVQLALGPRDADGGSPVFDAWLESTRLRDAELRVGQFFVPFDRARTIREFALQLVDRPDVIRELSLDRDVGAMVSSSDLLGLRGRLGYALFVGTGQGKNRFSWRAPGALFAARLSARPFGAFDDDREGDLSRDRKLRLALGVAVAHNARATRKGSTTGEEWSGATFDYVHAAVDVVVKIAGFSLLAEALTRQASKDAEGPRGAAEWSRSAWGWLAQAGVMVHEKVEVAARYEHLVPRSGTDPKLVELAARQGQQVAAGANLYLNGHALKLQADWVHRFGAAGAGEHLVRTQLDLSF